MIQDGRIAAMGPSGHVPIPAGARRIDGRGKFLMPGLADMHVHVDSTASLELFVAYGVTTVRNMWGAPVILHWRNEVARGALLGPTIYTAGPLLDGPNAVWTGSQVVENATDAEEAVKTQKQAGYDFLKVYARLQPAAYDAIIAVAKRHNMPVAGHVPSDVGLEHVLAQRQGSIEHVDGYIRLVQKDDSPALKMEGREEFFELPNYVDEGKMQSLARTVQAAGVWSCPTLIVKHRRATPEQLRAFRESPERRYLPPLVLASWDPSSDFRTRTWSPEFLQVLSKRASIDVAFTRALHAAGARLLLGTDQGNPFVVPGSSAITELHYLVEAGLSPWEAIRAGTHDAAEFLGAGEQFGTVAVGKRADLILVDADPLEDVANVARQSGVMVRGRYLSAGKIKTMLDKRVASYAPAPDRFVGRPPLPEEGRRVYSATYAIDMSGAVFGEERVVVSDLPNGRRVLRGQLVTDEPDPFFFDTRIELDAERHVVVIEQQGQRPEGHMLARLTREGDQAHLVVELPHVGRIERSSPLGAGEMAIHGTGGGFGTDGPLVLGLLASSPPKEAGPRPPRVSLRLDPMPGLYALPWTAELEANGYKLSVKTPNLRETQVITLDTEGWVQNARIEGLGVLGLTRIRKQP